MRLDGMRRVVRFNRPWYVAGLLTIAAGVAVYAWTPEPWRWLEKIKNAGAVFLGAASTEPVGDYFAGTNHILPTNGAARFSSWVASMLRSVTSTSS